MQGGKPRRHPRPRLPALRFSTLLFLTAPRFPQSSGLWPRQGIPFLLILSQAYQGTVAAHRLRFQQR
jgi:hypothetical protein